MHLDCWHGADRAGIVFAGNAAEVSLSESGYDNGHVHHLVLCHPDSSMTPLSEPRRGRTGRLLENFRQHVRVLPTTTSLDSEEPRQKIHRKTESRNDTSAVNMYDLNVYGMALDLINKLCFPWAFTS